MKQYLYILVAILAISISGCDNDNADSGLGTNTWGFQPDGFDRGDFKTKNTTLSVQGYQVFEATSMDNPGGGNNGIASTIKFFFKNVNPPPTGTYKVVEYEDLETEDQVAVYYQVFGDPRLGSQAYFFSHNDAGHTVSYTFRDGKVSVNCSAVPLYQTGTGPARGLLSANISQ